VAERPVRSRATFLESLGSRRRGPGTQPGGSNVAARLLPQRPGAGSLLFLQPGQCQAEKIARQVASGCNFARTAAPEQRSKPAPASALVLWRRWPLVCCLPVPPPKDLLNLALLPKPACPAACRSAKLGACSSLPQLASYTPAAGQPAAALPRARCGSGLVQPPARSTPALQLAGVAAGAVPARCPPADNHQRCLASLPSPLCCALLQACSRHAHQSVSCLFGGSTGSKGPNGRWVEACAQARLADAGKGENRAQMPGPRAEAGGTERPQTADWRLRHYHSAERKRRPAFDAAAEKLTGGRVHRQRFAQTRLRESVLPTLRWYPSTPPKVCLPLQCC